VLVRYLQAVGNLPTFSILVVASFAVLVVMGRYLMQHTDARTYRQPLFWVFGLIVVMRSVTNVASARFTLSIYVQLITQATPFIVILFSTLLFREKIPRFTLPAVSIALVGALMMIGTGFGSVADDPTRRDWLGVSLAVTSVILLGMYMVLVRRSVRHSISGESLLLIQMVGILIFSGVMTLVVREDWGRYANLDMTGWVVLGLYVFLVFLGGNLGQIHAIRHIGASFHSTMLASRLISAFIFGWLLLGEQLESVWQVAGAAIVLVTITWFLWQQRDAR
jgi:drug/metabolite transporter (DMT)-like permease